MKKRMSLLLALLLAVSLLTPVLTLQAGATVPPGSVQGYLNSLNSAARPYFDLSKRPDDDMTVEEFVALFNGYSYWSKGKQNWNQADTSKYRDRNGRLPSDWAAPFVAAEVDKGSVFNPAAFDYTERVTLAFVMEYLAHAKGKYSYDMVNYYSFTGLESLHLSNEQRLTLNTAVDYRLVSYTPGMDVSVGILRKQFYPTYCDPGTLPAPAQPAAQAESYRWSMAFFEDCYNDLAAHQAEGKTFMDNADNFNMLTMNTFYLRVLGGTPAYVRDDSRLDGVNAPLLEFCKAHHILVLAGLLNYYDASVLAEIQRDPSVADKVADELVACVDRYDLDGVNVDVELFGSTYRSAYSLLLQKISDRLHSRGKLVMATVGAYMRDELMQQSMYDYDVIGACCDIANVILYDDNPAKAYSQGSGKVGELSNFKYVNRCVQYAVAALGAEKVMVSVASYGVDFNVTAHTAENVTYDQIAALQKQHNAAASKTNDEVDDWHFSYTDGTGEHIVYYESEAGLANRLGLALRYATAGVACFELQSNYPALFALMGKPLSELDFRDVAKSAFYYNPVAWAVQNGVTTGVDKTHFAPNATCTRGQVVTFLWRAKGSPEPTKTDNPFVDVTGGYYYKAVLWAVENGITAGLDATHFGPNAPCTRGQVVTFLWRTEGKPEPTSTDNPFTDVTGGFYYDAVLWAVENKITAGMSATSFAPMGTCTRGQIVTFLYRDLVK